MVLFVLAGQKNVILCNLSYLFCSKYFVCFFFFCVCVCLFVFASRTQQDKSALEHWLPVITEELKGLF